MEENKDLKWANESALVYMDKANKRMFIAMLVAIIIAVGSNIGWLYYESQFEVVETSQQVEQEIDTGEGDATVIGIGDYNGEGETESKDNYTEQK
jgi:predicted negative regulator of RcsB-dependent stress response